MLTIIATSVIILMSSMHDFSLLKSGFRGHVSQA